MNFGSSRFVLSVIALLVVTTSLHANELDISSKKENCGPVVEALSGKPQLAKLPLKLVL
jgi:hypothetical protein